MTKENDEERHDNHDHQKDKYLMFSIEKEDYGIPVSCVTEIIGIQQITEMPEYPVYMRGIINLRNKIIPVMDVRLRFGKELRNYNNKTCTIIIEVKNISLGLIVDTVSEVLKIPQSDVAPPPQIGSCHQNRFIKGIGKVANGVKLLLDSEKLLDDDEGNKIIEYDEEMDQHL